MDDNLASARSLAESVRFSGDFFGHHSFVDPSQTKAFADASYQSGLRISPETTPQVVSELTLVLQRLNIPPTAVEAFVYASAEIAAECFFGDTSACVIRFSSQLIEKFEKDEFRFVAGHELGHFLLGHGITQAEQEESSPEHFMQQRSQEISADRLGLIACGGVETAMRALIKTISGLSRRHLKFDVGAFISQLGRSSVMIQEQQWSSSHPSLTFRGRALLWFSMSDCFNLDNGTFPKGCLDELDGRITRDLERFVDGPVRRRIERARTDLSIWIAAMEIVNRGSFGKGDQEQFVELFGKDALRGLKNFLGSLPKDEVREAVYGKMCEAREKLKVIIPSGFANELEVVRRTICAKFG